MLSRQIILSSFVAILVFATVARAHSWAACVDWRFNKGVNANSANAFKPNGGKCAGYARRFNTKRAWGTLDSDGPSRHYHQKHESNPIACSNGRAGVEKGANEQRANPVSGAYKSANAKFGVMTTVKKGSQLCLTWPSKNHAVKNEDENFVYIRMIKSSKEKKDARQNDFGKPIAKLPFKKCNKTGDQDKWYCGGCFKLPGQVTAGYWTLQWRWMLNGDGKEFYSSCADVLIKN